jgi:hypothetical protein
MMIHSLQKQTSDNWTALLLGEEEKREGSLIYINSEKSLDTQYVKEFRGDPGHTDKHHKIEIALQHIARFEQKPKYLIRLDDDDLISPVVISNIEKSGMNYDCYADRYQALYNIVDGKVALPHLPWMANSIFHKYEHAVTNIADDNRKLVNCSHSSAFHLFYSDKKVYYFPKYSPLYLRVLSETSLHIKTSEKASYAAHASKYGFWGYYFLKDYDAYIGLLVDKFQMLLGVKITRNIGRPLLVFALSAHWIKRALKKIRRKGNAILGYIKK